MKTVALVDRVDDATLVHVSCPTGEPVAVQEGDPVFVVRKADMERVLHTAMRVSYQTSPELNQSVDEIGRLLGLPTNPDGTCPEALAILGETADIFGA